MAMINPIEAIMPASHLPVTPISTSNIRTGGFADLLASGLARVESKVATADRLMQAFAEGEAIPIHQVTLALEQARLSVELAVQVRARLIETYRDFMSMQL